MRCRRKPSLPLAALLVLSALPAARGGEADRALKGQVLTVGPDREFVRIEEAYGAARPGATILVYPRKENKPYERTVLQVRKKGITFKAVICKDGRRVKHCGKGHEYRSPRAMFQFKQTFVPQADAVFSGDRPAQVDRLADNHLIDLKRIFPLDLVLSPCQHQRVKQTQPHVTEGVHHHAVLIS